MKWAGVLAAMLIIVTASSGQCGRPGFDTCDPESSAETPLFPWLFGLPYPGEAAPQQSQQPPIVTATYSDPPPYFGDNPSFANIKAKLIAAGQRYHIPPHILFGLAYQESGWNQFRSDRRTVYHLEPDGRVGVGIMQITVQPSVSDYAQLCTDIDYNIDRGASMLIGKWNATPIIGDGVYENGREKLENWYYALWAYNGWSTQNNPNYNGDSVYERKVLHWIANCPNGQWTSVQITEPTLAQIGTPLGHAVADTPQPVHKDSDYDGVLDGSCIAANASWTSTPAQGWYRTDQALIYATSGTSPSIQENPGGADGVIYVSEAGLCTALRDYSVHVWNACGDVTLHWSGGWDNVAPSASRTGGAAPNIWYTAAQSVSWSTSDANSGVKRRWYRWNGGAWVESSGPASLLEGKNTLEIQVEDNADNAGTASGNTAVVNLGEYWLDTVAPSISLSGPATSRWFNRAEGPKTVTWGATDATSIVATKTLTWDNGAHTDQIPEGKHVAIVSATDNAGNSASQSFGTWWIDATPPAPGVTFNPAAPNGENGWYTTNPTMTVGATDPNGTNGSGVSGVFYALDGGPETAFTLPETVTGDGIHTYSARATDIAGNSGATGDHIVKVDMTPPVFDSIYTDSESRSLNTLVATWSCSDPDSGIDGYEYWIGTTPGDDDVKGITNAGDSNWAYVVNLNLTPDQCYYFSVRAKNAAGLWSGTVISAATCVHPGSQDATPTFNSGGVSVPQEARTSTNYKIVDSIGQFVISTSESPTFVMEHGYWHSDFTPDVFATVGLAKAVENGRTLQIGTATDPLVVTSGTSIFADRFYLSQPDRSGGIAAQYGTTGGPALVEGDQVWLTGKINTVNGERMIQFASPAVVGHTDPLGPLYIGVPNIGGGTFNEWTPGVLDGIGLNNVGLLIKTCGGLVSYRDPQGRFFYLDNGDNLYDGSHYGMRIVCDGFVGGAKLAMPAYGKTIIVTGISSVEMIDNQPVRVMRPRRQSDIQILN